MIFFLFFLGLSVGSFLNVLIERIPKGEKFIYNRSHCDFCKRRLIWYDLIPLVSFILLQRRCRFCQGLISWQYPLVELSTGIIFVATYIYAAYTFAGSNIFFILISYLLIISALIAIFLTDLKYQIIPDQLIILLTVCSIFLVLLLNKDLLSHLLSGILFFLFFLALFLITKGRGMGFGDVKLSFFIGLFLGFPGTLVSFYLSFLTGSAVSLILIVTGRKTMKSTISFGPFLIFSTLIAFLFGDRIWLIFRGIIGI